MQMKGGRELFFAFDLILCAVILFYDMEGNSFGACDMLVKLGDFLLF